MRSTRAFALLAVIAIFTVTLSLGWELHGLRFVATVSLITAVLCQVVLVRALGFWAVPSLFNAILLLFHVGLTPFIVLGTELPVPDSPTQWVYTAEGRHAFWLAGLASAAFALGALLVPGRRRLRTESGVSPLSPRGQARLAWVGAIVLFVCVGAWAFVCVSRLGIGFVGSSYGAYKTATATVPTDYLFLGMSLGMVVLACSSFTTPGKVGLVVFAAFALVALPLGLRGEVLFPFTAFVGVLARHRKMPRLRTVVVSTLILLTVIANVKTVRQVGLSDLDQAQLGLTPLAAVAEMGYTLRTVQAEESWHAGGVDEREHGVTYAAPVERLLGRAHILGPPPPSASDWRLMNVETRAREGNIGGSVVAEAAHNFGDWGVVLVLVLFGLIAAALDGTTVRLRNDLFLGLIFTVMLQHVRNSFTPVPLQLLVGAVFFAVVLMVLRVHRAEESRGAGDARILAGRS